MAEGFPNASPQVTGYVAYLQLGVSGLYASRVHFADHDRLNVVERGLRGYETNMNCYPKIKLSLLRDIGWKLWDPIGLGAPGEGWPENCADEYDSYLLHVVGMLNQGKSTEEAVQYLDWVGAEHMGMGRSTAVARLACVATVQAITAYLQSLPEGPLSVR
jgi:hypothetical protein